jgi:release factor glutamine methyltransferase
VREGADPQQGALVGPGHPGTSRRPLGPTRREAVLGIAKEIREVGLPDERLEAERLVAHAVGVERSELLRAGSEPLTLDEVERLADAVSRRVAREPLQYIEGSVAFRDLVLVSDRRTLIPRPETEQLVQQVIRWARSRDPLTRGLDVGTGSGAIALSLLAEDVVRHMVGVDVSAGAIRQAAENRRRAGVSEAVFELRTVSGDLWSGIRPDERFDVIVSNPPYVRDSDIESLPPEVRDHEPSVALAGGPDGLDVIREIALRARERLNDGGALFLEIGDGQADLARDLFRPEGGWRETSIRHDLAGRERFLQALPD